MVEEDNVLALIHGEEVVWPICWSPMLAQKMSPGRSSVICSDPSGPTDIFRSKGVRQGYTSSPAGNLKRAGLSVGWNRTYVMFTSLVVKLWPVLSCLFGKAHENLIKSKLYSLGGSKVNVLHMVHGSSSVQCPLLEEIAGDDILSSLKNPGKGILRPHGWKFSLLICCTPNSGLLWLHNNDSSLTYFLVLTAPPFSLEPSHPRQQTAPLAPWSLSNR